MLLPRHTTSLWYLLAFLPQLVVAIDEWIVYTRAVPKPLKETIGVVLIQTCGTSNVETIRSQENGPEIFIVKAEEEKAGRIRALKSVCRSIQRPYKSTSSLASRSGKC